MPALGCGTLLPPNDAKTAILTALEAGFRLINASVFSLSESIKNV